IRDFQEMRKLPGRWKSDMEESAQKRLIVLLLRKLGSFKELKLENYTDMFVPSRVTAKKMAFHGHGYKITQDVFLENGRCAWAIEQLLNCELPEFSESLGSDEKRREQSIQASWERVVEAMALPPFQAGWKVVMPISKQAQVLLAIVEDD